MLMFGNLLKEVASTNRLADVASNAMMSIITILLGISLGASTIVEKFLYFKSLGILALGLFAFIVGTAGGVLFGKESGIKFLQFSLDSIFTSTLQTMVRVKEDYIDNVKQMFEYS